MADWLVDQRLRQAIAERRLLRCSYKHGGPRRVEPNDYGVFRGVERLLAYQTGGFSDSKSPLGWRMFDVAELRDIVVLDERFEGSRDANQRHRDWDEIWARVS